MALILEHTRRLQQKREAGGGSTGSLKFMETATRGRITGHAHTCTCRSCAPHDPELKDCEPNT
jgi:hypothetical protein